MAAEVGSPAPAFELTDQSRNPVSLDSLRGANSLIVFIPFPFTGNCDNEACAIRDQLATLNGLEARVVVITCHAVSTTKRWADENGLEYPVLSDFWPHGEVARAYGAFNEDRGVANRFTFVLDAAGIVREIINTDSLGVAREFDRYVEALNRI